MRELLDWLSGRKTYILATLFLVTSICAHFGIIDSETTKTLQALFGGGALVTLRAGVKKSESE